MKPKKLRIYAFTDLHGSAPAMKNVISKSRKSDILLCAGDISWFCDNLDGLIKRLADSRKTLIITHGNHESPQDMRIVCKRYKHIIFLHKNVWKLGKYLFFAYGGGGFSDRDPTFERAVKKLKNKFKNHKLVLIIHAPPYGTKLDIVQGQHVGNRSITEFIRKFRPLLAISGHIHECEGKKQKLGRTLVVNPGKGMEFKL